MKTIFASELMNKMSETLKSTNENDDLTKAIDNIHTAMKLLDEAGLTSVSNQILNVLVKVARDGAELDLENTEISMPSVKSLIQAGLSMRDLYEFGEGNKSAIAKMNLALRNLNMSESDIVKMIGHKNLMSEEAAISLLGKTSHHGDWKNEENDDLVILPKIDPNEINIHTVNAAKKKVNKKKTDWHTKKLNSKKMVDNLKDHGTVFNMNDDNLADATDEQKEYYSWLKKTRKPDIFTKNDVDPELADLMDVEDFDLNSSDDDLDDLLNLDVEDQSLEVLENPALQELDFEEEKD